MTAAALGTTLALETFDGAARPRRAPRHPVRRLDHPARARRHPPAGHRPRRPRRAHRWCRPRPGSTPRRRSCSAQLAAARGEERPEGRVANPAEGSIFGKLRDAFKAATARGLQHRSVTLPLHLLARGARGRGSATSSCSTAPRAGTPPPCGAPGWGSTCCSPTARACGVEGEVVAVGAGTLDLRVRVGGQRPRAAPAVRARAGAGQERPRRPGGRGGHRVRGRRGRAVAGVAQRGAVARGARREGPAQVGCRARGRHQAVPPHPASGARAHGHDRRRRRRGCAARQPPSCCTRTPTAPLAGVTAAGRR